MIGAPGAPADAAFIISLLWPQMAEIPAKQPFTAVAAIVVLLKGRGDETKRRRQPGRPG